MFDIPYMYTVPYTVCTVHVYNTCICTVMYTVITEISYQVNFQMFQMKLEQAISRNPAKCFLTEILLYLQHFSS